MAFPRLSIKHSTSRLLALFFALLVYAHVYTEQQRSADFTLPLRVQGLPRELVLMSDPPENVSLTLSGTGKQLVKLRVRPPQVVFDLSQARPGDVQRIISPADVLLPPSTGVVVEAIQAPKVVTLVVDTLITRRLPVEVSLSGDIKRGFFLKGSVSPEPDHVLVQGPQSSVASLTSLATEPLDLSRITDSVSLTLSLRPDSALSVHPSEVAVSLELIPTQTKTVVVTVEARGSGARAVRVLPETATVHLEGPRDALEQSDPRVLRLWVEIDDLSQGLHTMTPQISLPIENIEVRAIVPSEFLVDVGG